MDLRSPPAPCRRMDSNTRDLIRQLCTRAGTIMENISPPALLAPQEERLDDLVAAAEAIIAILIAAQTLRSRSTVSLSMPSRRALSCSGGGPTGRYRGDSGGKRPDRF